MFLDRCCSPASITSVAVREYNQSLVLKNSELRGKFIRIGNGLCFSLRTEQEIACQVTREQDGDEAS